MALPPQTLRLDRIRQNHQKIVLQITSSIQVQHVLRILYWSHWILSHQKTSYHTLLLPLRAIYHDSTVL